MYVQVPHRYPYFAEFDRVSIELFFFLGTREVIPRRITCTRAIQKNKMIDTLGDVSVVLVLPNVEM